MQLHDQTNLSTCFCNACTGLISGDSVLIDGVSISLDPFAGFSYRDKPIATLDEVVANANRTGWDFLTNNYGELDDGVLNYGFWQNIQELQNSYYVSIDGEIAFNEAFNADAFAAFNAGQQASAVRAIDAWDDLIDISFQQTRSGAADITFGITTAPGAGAYAYLPFGDIFDADPIYEELGFEEIGRLSGDVWLARESAANFNPLTDSYYGSLTIIHEIGHSLGLSHPGDYNATDDDDGDGVADPITYDGDAFFAQDSLQYSVMSYFDGFETGAQHIDYSLNNFVYAATPLVHDVAAVQAIYGADMTTRTGDTVYGFNSTANRTAFDFTINTRPIVTIWDAGGVDTIDFSGWNTPSIIDLNDGAFSSGGGLETFPTLAQVNANRAALGFAPRSQATFDLIMSIGAQAGTNSPLYKDNISIAYGAVIENAIGGGGADVLIGNGVANVLTGNGGIDFASYESSAAGVVASLATGGSAGDAAGDTYVGIEGLRGSESDDTLSGDANDNIFEGLGGADAFDGGDGTDTVTYSLAFAAVTVSLLGGGTGDAAGDSFVGIENLTGSDFDDVLGGNAVANVIDGGDGDDTLFYGATAAVQLNLATGGTGGLAAGDTYVGIENVRGSNLADNITGDANANVITGGLGNDILNGGAGFDTVDYADSTTGVTVNLSNNFVNGGARGDVISNFENIIGSALGDVLTGTDGVNEIAGGAGNDTISSALGADTVDGGAGNDTVRGGAGNDLIDGGDGNDSLRGENDADTIFGGAGDDSLDGGAGNDTLDGEGGVNTLIGGSGNDIFAFTVLDGGRDVVGDFRRGSDKIDVSGIDAIAGTDALDAFTFIGSADFTGAGQLRVFSDAGVFSLGGDVDGDGVADLLVALTGLTTLTATDILFA